MEVKKDCLEKICLIYVETLIAWSIEAALKSKYISKVIVSSDDEEILNIAKKSIKLILLKDLMN